MSPSPARARLVLVDDSAPFLDALDGYLRGFPELDIAGRAATGEQAVALTRVLAPDVVVMDIKMPGIGGIEATRVIKSLPQAPTVLVLTLNEQEEVRRTALEAGADYFIVKDRLFDDFPAVLAKIESARS